MVLSSSILVHVFLSLQMILECFCDYTPDLAARKWLVFNDEFTQWVIMCSMYSSLSLLPMLIFLAFILQFCS